MPPSQTRHPRPRRLGGDTCSDCCSLFMMNPFRRRPRLNRRQRQHSPDIGGAAYNPGVEQRVDGAAPSSHVMHEPTHHVPTPEERPEPVLPLKPPYQAGEM